MPVRILSPQQFGLEEDFRQKVEYALNDLKGSGLRGLRDIGLPQTGEVLSNAIDSMEAASNVRSIGAQVGMGVRGLGRRIVGDWEGADEDHRWARAYEAASQKLAENNYISTPQAVGRTLATSIIPSAAAARATGSPTAAIGTLGALVGSQSLGEARELGKSPGEALTYAAKQTAAEVIPALVMGRIGRKAVPGLGGVESALAGNLAKGGARAIPRALTGVAGEAIEEGVTEAFQAPTQADLEERPLSREEYLARIAQAAGIGAVGGGVVGGAQVVGGLNRDAAAGRARAARQAAGPQTRTVDPEGLDGAARTAVEAARSLGDTSRLEALASKPEPSRSDWRASGMPPELGASATARKTFVTALRSHLSDSDSSAGFDITSPTQPATGPDANLPRVDPRGVSDAIGTLAAYERNLSKKYGEDFLTKATREERDRYRALSDNIASIAPKAATPTAPVEAVAPIAPTQEQVDVPLQQDQGPQEARQEEVQEATPDPRVLRERRLAELQGLPPKELNALARQYAPAIRGWKRGAQIDLILNNEIKEPINAGPVRSDEGQVPQVGPVTESRPAEGSADIQQPPPQEPGGPPQEVAPPSRPVGRVPVSKETMALTFPQTLITPTQKGYRVEAGQSFFDIEFPEKIPVTPGALAKLLGRSPSEQELAEFGARGSFGIRTADGKRHSGLGLIQMAQDLSGPWTLRHEALHLARQAGFLTPKEWAILAKRYTPEALRHAQGKGRTDPLDVDFEEAVAKSKETWKENRTLWQRIQSWLRRILASFGYDRRTAEDIHKMMTEAGFWQRKASRPRTFFEQIADEPAGDSFTEGQAGQENINKWANFLMNEKLEPKRLDNPQHAMALVKLAEEMAKEGPPKISPYASRLDSRRRLALKAMELGIDLTKLEHRGKLAMARSLLDAWNLAYKEKYGGTYGTAGAREAARRDVKTRLADERKTQPPTESFSPREPLSQEEWARLEELTEELLAKPDVVSQRNFMETEAGAEYRLLNWRAAGEVVKEGARVHAARSLEKTLGAKWYPSATEQLRQGKRFKLGDITDKTTRAISPEEAGGFESFSPIEPQERPISPGFFSKLLEVASSGKVGRVFDRDQLVATLGNAGVKQEEMIDADIDGVFDGRERVTKDQLMAWLGEHAVRVEEVLKGDRKPVTYEWRDTPDGGKESYTNVAGEREINGPYQVRPTRPTDLARTQEARDYAGRAEATHGTEWADNYRSRWPEHAPYQLWGGGGIMGEFGSIEEAIEHVHNLQTTTSSPTKFGQYKLPGGENYRELLLKLPNPQAEELERKQREMGRERRALEDEYRTYRKNLRAKLKEENEYKDIPKEIADVLRLAQAIQAGERNLEVGTTPPITEENARGLQRGELSIEQAVVGLVPEEAYQQWRDNLYDIDAGSGSAVMPGGFQKRYEDHMLRQAALDTQRDAMPGQFQSSHWSEKDVLAHVRFDDRTDADGKKVLMIEEIQSDWHQQGRKRGYHNPASKPETPIRDNVTFESTPGGPGEITATWTSPRGSHFTGYGVSEDQAFADITEQAQRGAFVDQVPNAPLKTAWPMLAMKRMIRWAAENGYDRVAWTQGKVHYDRWGSPLVTWQKQPDGRFLVAAKEQSGGIAGGVDLENEARARGILLEREGIVVDSQKGIELLVKSISRNSADDEVKADKVWKRMQESEAGSYLPRKEFFEFRYDSELPQETNKIIKKYGGRVGKTTIGEPDMPDTEARRIAQELRVREANFWQSAQQVIIENGNFGFENSLDAAEAILRNGDWASRWEVVSDGARSTIERWREPALAFRRHRAQHAPEGWGRVETDTLGPTQVHAFDITDSMRQEVMGKGLPYYQETGPEGRTQMEQRRLANPATDPAVREFVDITRAGMPALASQSEEQWRAEAAKALEPENKEATRKRILNIGRSMGMLRPSDTMAARSLMDEEGPAALADPTPEKLMDLMKMIQAYTRSGTTPARALRARRDSVEDNPQKRLQRLLTEAVLEPSEALKKDMTRAQNAGDVEAYEKALKQWAIEVPALKERFKRLGVDLDNLPTYDAVEAARALKVMQTERAPMADKMFEWFRNLILSAPSTHFANTTGNFGHAAWHFTARRLAAVAVNQVIRDPRGPQIGELVPMYKAMLPAMSRASINFIRTFQTELPQFARQHGRGREAKFDIPNVAIRGRKGEAIRVPQRLLLAADDYAETLFANMEATAYAYRMAKEEGLTGDAMDNRMAELVADFDSPAWMHAYGVAEELTFKQEGSPTGQRFKEAALQLRRVFGFRYVLPFITTPANIFETAIKASPLGSLAIAKRAYQKMHKNYQAKKPIFEGLGRGEAENIAQQLLSTAAFLAIMGQDDDDPWITGGEPESTVQKRALSSRTGQMAQSINTRALARALGSDVEGDQWISYARLEPFATVLSTTTDATNFAKRGATYPAAKDFSQAMAQQIGDKTFLAGIGDLFRIVQYENGIMEGAGRYGSNLLVSMTVPNIARSAGRAASGYQQQQGIWGDPSVGIDNPESWWAMLMTRHVQRSELPYPKAQETFPVYDLWGRQIPMSKSPVPQTDWVYRFLSPIANRSVDEIFVGDRLMMNWNNQNPDQPHYGSLPKKSYKQGGQIRYFSDEEFADYTKRAGELTREMVEAYEGWNIERPTGEDMEILGRMIKRARAQAKAEIVSGEGIEDEAE